MAEINNLNEISENFDTIKTLLNSIRAQGILNTSDVDKLLGGINSKLEKINTDEDIDLIKIFLTDLKQSLDERHSVLLSKFGAIESLFSNLLKNSSEMLKSSEVKELFDIVATNLSVFSREVVSQKDSLSDITMRLDAIQSDDTQKKEIIKSVTQLKTDIDRISNGFDSIVLSLNENFKSVIKSVSELDQNDSITEFGSQIADIVSSSNTILSALQLIDKKQVQIEETISSLPTQDDISSTKRSLNEIFSINKQVSDSVDTLVEKNYKLDNLAEKIDASVNIVAGLKAVISESDEKSSQAIIDRLNEVDEYLKQVSSRDQFEDIKSRLEAVIHDIINNSVLSFNTTGDKICEHVSNEVDKVSQLVEVNATRTLGDLNSNAEVINTRLKETHAAIADLCRTSFSDVKENLSGLKDILSQLDENNVSANNAIFANITDRLTMFENSLKSSLDRQEDYVSSSSEKVLEKMSEVRNISGNMDYKLDSSIIELNNSKKEFEELKTSVQGLLELDFINVVKELRVDLYAIKQDLSNAVDSETSELSEKITEDLFSKYQLLISKLDNVEDEVRKVQRETLENISGKLENISSGIVDILSYVSSENSHNTEIFDSKIEDLTRLLGDNQLNYVEDVRGIVDVIRERVENNLAEFNRENANVIQTINSSIADTAHNIKIEIKNSYDKLAEIQNSFNDMRENLNINNITNATNIENILSSSEQLKEDFEFKLSALKASLLDKVSEFQKDFTCDNADKFSELKFNSENLFSKAAQNSSEIKAELVEKIENILSNFEQLEGTVNNLSTQTTTSLSSTLAKILENFVSVKSVINTQGESSAEMLKENVEEIKKDFANLKEEFRNADSRQDEDLTRQMNIIESGFQSINSLMTSLMEENKSAFSYTISEELQTAADKMGISVAEKLELYKSNLENLFDNFNQTSNLQAEFIKEKVIELNKILEDTLQKQSSYAKIQLTEISTQMKAALSDSLEVSAADYDALKQNLKNFYNKIEHNNLEFIDGVKSQLDDIAKFVDSGLTIQAQEVNTSFEQINDGIDKITSVIQNVDNEVSQKIDFINKEFNEFKEQQKDSIDEQSAEIIKNIENVIIRISEDSVAQRKSTAESITKTIVSKNTEIHNLLSKANELSNNTIMVQAKAILDELINIQGKSTEQINKIKNILKDEVETEIINIGDKISSLFEENSLNMLTNLSNTNTSICDELKANAIEIKAAFENLNSRMDKDELSQMQIYKAQIKELSGTFNSLISEAKDVTKTEVATISETLIKNGREVMEEVNSSIEDKITSLLASNADIAAGELQTIETFATEILNQVEGAKQNTIVCKDMISKLIKEEIDIISKNIEKETDVILGDIGEQLDILKDSQKENMSLLTTQLEGSVEGYIIDSVNDLKSYLDIKTDSSIMDEKVDSLRQQLDSAVDILTGDLNKLVELSVFNNAISDLKSTNEVLVTSAAETMNNRVEEFINSNVTQKLNDKLNIFDKKFVDLIVEKYEEIKTITSNYNNTFEKVSDSIQNILSDFEVGKEDISKKLANVLTGINYSIDVLKQSFDELKAQILNRSFDEALQTSLNNQISGIENLVQEQSGYLEDISELCCNNLPEISEMSVIVKHNIQNSINDLISKVETQSVDYGKSLNNLKSDIITQFLNIFNQISFVAEQEEILDFIQQKHSELITILSHIVTTSDSIETVKDNLSVVDNKMDSLKEDVDLLNEKVTAIMSSDGNVDYVYSLQDLESDIANLRLVLNDMKKDLNSQETQDDYEEFKQKINDLAEDIVSISTRTNKLILASDESNKALLDNLNDFKLVIDDLDERTRNFSRESGIERIDNKLGAINTMIQNGAKTNQVFNEIFEYLAEWVDKAGAQIATITDRVETLDDISQIKLMLEDLKAESEDNSESDELVEALGNVFDKQTKRISSLEAKLDRIIVDNTINNRPQKLDVTPFEDTLNRFLVAIDDKIVSQQRKINSLESKLEEVMSLIDNKDTAQLTKKVGGMDRQIAKLNKSIEKIASHVVEK